MLLVVPTGTSDTIFEQGFKYVIQVITPATRNPFKVLDAIKAIDPKAKIAILARDDEFSRLLEGALLKGLES